MVDAVAQTADHRDPKVAEVVEGVQRVLTSVVEQALRADFACCQ